MRRGKSSFSEFSWGKREEITKTKQENLFVAHLFVALPG
jgi:hypothetical protein